MTGFFEWLVPAANAHEKWFVDAGVTVYDTPAWFMQWNKITMLSAVGVIVAAVVFFFLDQWFEQSKLYEKLEKRVHKLRDYASGILAATTAITLLWYAKHGMLFADNLIAPEGDVGTALLIAEALIGVALLVGLFTVGASVGLIVLYLSMFLVFPFTDVLDYLHYVAIAVFLLAFARGRYSLDWFLGKSMISTAATRKKAYLAMRVITGVTFILLALGKWTRPDLHFQLMDAYPDFNPYTILQSLGVTWLERDVYVYIMFLNEFFVGIAVLAGFVTRIAALALLPIFTVSVLFLGWGDIFGHIPILGILFVLFVYGDLYHKGGVRPKKS